MNYDIDNEYRLSFFLLQFIRLIKMYGVLVNIDLYL